MGITTVFFDIDDTLINHSEAEKKAFLAIRSKYFRKVPAGEFIKVWIEKTRENWHLFEIKKLTFSEQRQKRVIEVWNNYGEKITAQQADWIFTEYLSFYEKFWKPFAGVRTVLKRLRKMKVAVGVISNGNKDQQLRKLKKTGINIYIERKLIFISEEVGFAKPQKEIFILSQVAAKAKPHEILFVGDSFKADIEPTTALGWKNLYVNHYDPEAKKEFKKPFYGGFFAP